MPFIEVGDLSIYHEFHGTGPPLLHISGSGGDLRTTAPRGHGLNESFEGLHYDQRGLGQTSAGTGVPTMERFADDAAALCEAVGWSRCHVIGSSFGGMVAQHLAIRRPDLVDRLVLNCTSPGGDAPSYPLHELEGLDPDDRADVYLPLLDTRCTDDGEIPGLEGIGQLLRQQPATAGREGSHRQLEARRHHDATAGLADITAPTLVCAGRYDAIAPLGNAERLAAAIPGARLEVFEGGHIFMLQDPRATELTRQFLAGRGV